MGRPKSALEVTAISGEDLLLGAMDSLAESNVGKQARVLQVGTTELVSLSRYCNAKCKGKLGTREATEKRGKLLEFLPGH